DGSNGDQVQRPVLRGCRIFVVLWPALHCSLVHVLYAVPRIISQSVPSRAVLLL
ncbi:hypothetical protein H4R26_006185, partial [Coemansia thaxteri]